MAYCTDWQIIGHNIVFLKKLNVRKDWKQFLAKITTIRKPSVNFWITLRKLRDLSGNFDTMFFYKSMKKNSLKTFVKISLSVWKTFVTVGQGYD